MSDDSHITSDYEVGQDNIQVFGLDIHNPVFAISSGLIVAFVVAVSVFQVPANDFFGWLRPAVTEAFDWLLAIAGNAFVLFCLVLALSPLGKIRLGGADARPDYSYTGWFAMLFAAGMGIGLMFFGVSEPISHFTASIAEDAGTAASWAPLGGAPGDFAAARDLAMAATIFHWGLHPWAIYAVVGLALAFFSYNRGLPLTLRSTFYPILGERAWGWPGHAIDTLAVFATLFGLATSLGFGAEQALAGLNHVFGMPVTETNKILLIIGITSIALLSVVAGLDAGVKRLSEINMVLAALLMGFVLVLGPTLAILSGFVQSLWSYIAHLPALSNFVGRTDGNFFDGWTAFYWAWWISWSPFVGMFIARVSRGRTVREFITCVLLVPSLVCILWMSIFGGTALDQILVGGGAALQDAELPLQLFVMLDALPLSSITSVVGVVLVIVFFVTSSDSGSLVIDTITAGGKVDAPVPQRIFWAVFEGLVAIVLLAAGGLAALQAAAITTGIPFAIVLLVMCYALWRGLSQEKAFVAARADPCCRGAPSGAAAASPGSVPLPQRSGRMANRRPTDYKASRRQRGQGATRCPGSTGRSPDGHRNAGRRPQAPPRRLSPQRAADRPGAHHGLSPQGPSGTRPPRPRERRRGRRQHLCQSAAIRAERGFRALSERSCPRRAAARTGRRRSPVRAAGGRGLPAADADGGRRAGAGRAAGG
ncbi:Glycine betaine transporter OpuD [Methylobrevis pamukkalensis]|uniref:Glycine betaine transporter OpuD n=1 Tax=Methylobrevis pamukkalensis TaxID=1439726 RepID=A0A1E3H851_9HYPH|nr:Glycine betaine transporter OpuD [Methylobrevis pamukkalensis]